MPNDDVGLEKMWEQDSGDDEAVRSPTIYDVARAAGVAPSTVSRAFSRPGRVSAETAARIMRVANEIGYRTNPIARALPTGRTSLIAMIVADLTNPFFFKIIRGAERHALASGYTLLVTDAQESGESEKRVLERVLPLVEGLILVTSRMSNTAIRNVAKQKPTVLLNRVMTDVPNIVTDNARGMRLVVEHLHELGHNVITYVAGPEASWADGMRWRAMRETAHELGIRVRRLGPFQPTVEGGRAAARAFAHQRSSAVVAYNDLLAIGMMHEIVQMGGQIPRDVSVVGFDDIFGADFCVPPLTTVASPLSELGLHSVRLLIDQIAQSSQARPTAAPQRVRPALLPAKLEVRQSTAVRKARRSIPWALTQGSIADIAG